METLGTTMNGFVQSNMIYLPLVTDRLAQLFDTLAQGGGNVDEQSPYPIT